MIRYAVVILLMASPAFAQDAGTAAWTAVYEVFSHPRCANCHVGPDNVPMWSGSSYGAKPRPHGMNIGAGASRIGAESIPCSSCHALQNSQLPHGREKFKKTETILRTVPARHSYRRIFLGQRQRRTFLERREF